MPKQRQQLQRRQRISCHHTAIIIIITITTMQDMGTIAGRTIAITGTTGGRPTAMGAIDTVMKVPDGKWSEPDKK